jgi:hypothetical protein
VENKLEFLLNEMVEEHIIGIKRTNNGLIEQVYYYKL